MNVNLYTISTCPFSQQEKTFLGEKGVLFTEVVLDKTPDKLPQFSAVNDGFSGVPLAVVTQNDGTVNTIKGFSAEELGKVLHLEGNQITLRQDSGQAENPSTNVNTEQSRGAQDKSFDSHTLAQDKQTADNSQPATNSSYLPNPSTPPDPSLDQSFDSAQDKQNSAPPQDLSQVTPPPVPTETGDGQTMQPVRA